MFSLTNIHMIAVLKKQDGDMPLALLLTKSQSFSLYKEVKVRDCPLDTDF